MDFRERAHAAVVEHSPAKALSRGERQTAHNAPAIKPSRIDHASREAQSPNDAFRHESSTLPSQTTAAFTLTLATSADRPVPSLLPKPPMGLEPMTSPLPRECSTTELRWRVFHVADCLRGPARRRPSPPARAGMKGRMIARTPTPENLQKFHPDTYQKPSRPAPHPNTPFIPSARLKSAICPL